MPPDTDYVYGIALVAIALWIALIYFVVTGASKGPPELPPRRFNRTGFRPRTGGRAPVGLPTVRGDPPPPDSPGPGYADEQLDAVMAASFRRQRLLNYSEYRTFRIIESDLAAMRRGYRIFAQTNLGEILRSPDEKAFRSINSKRVDMLIVDRDGWPVVAVEYQGSGHFLSGTTTRDAVKMAALRKAGIRFIEVSDRDDEDDIRARIRKQLGDTGRPGMTISGPSQQ